MSQTCPNQFQQYMWVDKWLFHMYTAMDIYIVQAVTLI